MIHQSSNNNRPQASHVLLAPPTVSAFDSWVTHNIAHINPPVPAWAREAKEANDDDVKCDNSQSRSWLQG